MSVFSVIKTSIPSFDGLDGRLVLPGRYLITVLLPLAVFCAVRQSGSNNKDNVNTIVIFLMLY